MPVTRKSTRSRGGAAAAASSAAQGKQQTLSFNHRVTKPTVKTGKDLLAGEKTPDAITAKTKDVTIKDEDEVTEVQANEPEAEAEEELKTKPAEKAASAKAKKAAASKTATKTANKTNDDVKEAVEEKEGEGERTEIEKKALSLPQSAIDRYWLGIDSARMARAVHRKHTEGLTTGEKVLRYFDVSSHYGVSLFFSVLPILSLLSHFFPFPLSPSLPFFAPSFSFARMEGQNDGT